MICDHSNNGNLSTSQIETRNQVNNDVYRSLKGFIVKKKDFNKQLYLRHICAKEPRLIAEMLSSRNVAVASVANYLDPKLKNLLPKPNVLKDIDNAVSRVLNAILNNEKICIFGDYDVDGSTSTSMLILFLRQLGV